jgi:signal transduction histidine kinase
LEAKARESKAREIVHGFTDLFVKSPAPMALSAWGSLSAPGLGSGMAVNEAFESLFGIGRQEAMGKPWYLAPRWGDNASFESAGAALEAAGCVDMLKVGFVNEANQSQIWCAVSARPVVWEGVNALLWTYQDISKQEALLMDLEGFNCELEARVEGKALELDSARKELRRRERLANLGELVAGVAHEINTPIGNALLSASTMSEPAMRLAEMAKGAGLSRSELASVSKKLSDASDLAMVNLKKASEIIGNFKQLSADQAGESRRQYTVYEVAAGALKAMGTAMKGQSVAWRVSGADGAETLDMDGYPGALSQIVGIMANNALSHAYGEEIPGGEPRLFEVFVERASEGWIKMSFVDNGQGLGAGLASRVFEPFFTTKAGRGGTGLGLAIAWNLARDAMGGELVVTEHDRPGCRFDLLMPRKAPDSLVQSRLVKG